MNPSLRRILVWDWAVRGFHWLFAGCVAAALLLALLGGEHSPWFPWHMVFGLAAGFLLAVRLLLGFVGSRHVRWTAFGRAVADLPRYLRALLTGHGDRAAGHHPLAWLTYGAMFVLLALTVWTGANMRTEWAEEIHPALAWALLVTIVAHLSGLAAHTFRYRENVALSMVSGFKQGRPEEAIGSARPLFGAVVVLGSLIYLAALFRGYDARAGHIRLPVLGTVISMGEHEGEEDGREEDHDDNDDDDFEGRHRD